jgi:hypothetical protein
VAKTKHYLLRWTWAPLVSSINSLKNTKIIFLSSHEELRRKPAAAAGSRPLPAPEARPPLPLEAASQSRPLLPPEAATAADRIRPPPPWNPVAALAGNRSQPPLLDAGAGATRGMPLLRSQGSWRRSDGDKSTAAAGERSWRRRPRFDRFTASWQATFNPEDADGEVDLWRRSEKLREARYSGPE